MRIKFKVTVPKDLLNLHIDRRVTEIESTITDTLKLSKIQYEHTTSTWAHKPKFTISHFRRTGNSISRDIYTKDEVYGYLDDGTRGHMVRPRRARRLRFQPNYTTKTQRWWLGSRIGGSYGPFAYSRGHYVRGIQAREYTKIIADLREPWFAEQVFRLMKI
jgi:hypothetical protein